MKKQPYHHKNLRNSLIEKGIELVSMEGIQSFSLRKVASACGVSHAAPYSHFQSKEELLDAMQLYITDKFSLLLENAIKENTDATKILQDMGLMYISFFVENPTYFQFLYSQSNMKIDLSLSIADNLNYKPFIIYRNAVIKILDQVHYPKEKQDDTIIAIWAFIHGITSLATLPNVHYDKDWKQKVFDFMEIFQLSFINNMEMEL